jgi:hypothetical protein
MRPAKIKRNVSTFLKVSNLKLSSKKITYLESKERWNLQNKEKIRIFLVEYSEPFQKK